MKKILVSVFILISLFDFILPQEDSLKIKRIYKQLNDSLFMPGKEITADSTAKIDSAQIVRDSLKALQQKPLIPIVEKGLLAPYEFGTTLSRKKLLFSDYRFTGDLVNQSSPVFIRDLGMLGQPDEVLVYGAGFNNISYLQDGISINNRFTNSLNLNNIESESIDSIEIIPMVRGFLYGTTMNPVSVNLISKNNPSIEGKTGAYSRMRYYQASNEEAFIDAIFRTNISRRLISIFEMTNESIDDRFKNSSYDAWKANVKLNYILSDNFNLIGNYNFLKSQVHLFGGLNIDSLAKLNTAPVSDTGYPVIYPALYRKVTEHNVFLKLVNNLSSNLSGELNTYYRFNLLEYRQNEQGTIANEEIISRNHITKVFGSTFREVLDDSLFSADVFAGYEKVFIKTDFSFKEAQVGSASLSGKLSFKLDENKFIPSLFGKYLYFDNQSFYGFGGDATYHFSPLLSFYGGVSYFQKPLNIFQYEDIKNANIYNPNAYEINFQKIKSVDIGVKINQEYIHATTNLFYRKINNDVRVYPSFSEMGNNIYNSHFGIYNFFSNEIFGTSLNLQIKIWKVLLECNASYYLNRQEYTTTANTNDQIEINNSTYRKYLLPEYYLKGGIYFSDSLFNSNLNLKAGFNTTAVGVQNLYSYDFETNTLLSWYSISFGGQIQENATLLPSIVFNFLLIGEIQDRATIYFTFENLFDKQYYVVPYYLKQGRGIRLGVSWEFLN
jgi:hypothetical protein